MFYVSKLSHQSTRALSIHLLYKIATPVRPVLRFGRLHGVLVAELTDVMLPVSRKPLGLTFKKNLVCFLITSRNCFLMSPVWRVGQGCDMEAKCTKGIISFVQQSEAKGRQELASFC